MDSDDDFNSVASGSEDGFGEDVDSSVDFGAGAFGLTPLPYLHSKYRCRILMLSRLRCGLHRR